VTLIVVHRVNDPVVLAATPVEYGVEIDLHADGDELVLVHDPFSSGPMFAHWLDSYQHAFIVLNTKEEGLETRIEAMLGERGISEWAYLDQSFPYLVKTLLRSETRTMVRVSEYERSATPLDLAPRPQWVWVDSFHGTWPSATELRALVEVGYRLMLVSPELQGRDPEREQPEIEALFTDAGLLIDGVCTKRPNIWNRPEAPWWRP
jgi:hypothetical protein